MNGLSEEDKKFIKGQPIPKTEENGLPEAPASVTLSVVTPKGYNALFTLRENTGKSLLIKITGLEFDLEKLGYKPQVKGFPKKEIEYVEGKFCPKCKGRMVKKTKRDGSIFHQCENKKWENGKNVGSCDYTDWLNPPIKVEKYDEYTEGDY